QKLDASLLRERHHLAVLAAGDETLAVPRRSGCQEAVMRLCPCVAARKPVNDAVRESKNGNVAEKTGGDAMSGKVEWCDCGHASGLARLECLLQPLRIQLPPDEDQAALAPFAFLPRPLMVALDDHVDALHDIALRIILEGDDALEPQDVGQIGRASCRERGGRARGAV